MFPWWLLGDLVLPVLIIRIIPECFWWGTIMRNNNCAHLCFSLPAYVDLTYFPVLPRGCTKYLHWGVKNSEGQGSEVRSKRESRHTPLPLYNVSLLVCANRTGALDQGWVVWIPAAPYPASPLGFSCPSFGNGNIHDDRCLCSHSCSDIHSIYSFIYTNRTVSSTLA